MSQLGLAYLSQGFLLTFYSLQAVSVHVDPLKEQNSWILHVVTQISFHPFHSPLLDVLFGVHDSKPPFIMLSTSTPRGGSRTARTG